MKLPLDDQQLPRAHRAISRRAAPGCGWLCPSEGDRARMLDMGPRVRRARNVVTAAIGVGMVLSMSLAGLSWIMLLLFGVAILNLATLERRIRRASRPERVVAANLSLIGLLIIAATGLTRDGATSLVLALVVIPVSLTALRFRDLLLFPGVIRVAAGRVRRG